MVQLGIAGGDARFCVVTICTTREGGVEPADEFEEDASGRSRGEAVPCPPEKSHNMLRCAGRLTIT
eukprot:5623914-Lingulodinium_polyedra.AAC.1